MMIVGRDFLPVVFLVALFAGCVPLVGSGPSDSPDQTGGDPVDSDPVDPPDDIAPQPPRVSLFVSNPTPGVLEEVRLTCTLESAESGPVTYDFQPDDGRLFFDRRGNTASFIVESTDVGVATIFTCTATNAAGESAPSNAEVIVPTG